MTQEQAPGNASGAHLRPAPAARELHPLIAGRWSPRSFADEPVEEETLARLFEAARWAPSSWNDQPWSYVLARRSDPDWFDALGGLLSSGNSWALEAPVLALSVVRTRLRRDDRPNRHAWHDVGAASENLFLQAFDEGLVMHEMAGFDREAARDLLGLPEEEEPCAMIAIGHPGREALRRAGEGGADRSRRPLEAFVFEGGWDEPADL